MTVTTKEFPFVAVHMRGEKIIHGEMHSENKWSISMCWMTNNDRKQGRNIQINHDQIEMIESMDPTEAPWNQDNKCLLNIS